MPPCLLPKTTTTMTFLLLHLLLLSSTTTATLSPTPVRPRQSVPSDTNPSNIDNNANNPSLRACGSTLSTCISTNNGTDTVSGCTLSLCSDICREAFPLLETCCAESITPMDLGVCAVEQYFADLVGMKKPLSLNLSLSDAVGVPTTTATTDVAGFVPTATTTTATAIGAAATGEGGRVFVVPGNNGAGRIGEGSAMGILGTVVVWSLGFFLL